MKNRRTRSTIVAATTLAVILAGCGGEPDEPQVLPSESASAEGDAPEDAVTDAGDGASQDADTTSQDADTTSQDGDGGEEADATSQDADTTSQDGGGGEEAGLPTVPVEYADALVRAWGAGDQDTMAQLGTAEVVHILGDGGGPNWDQTGSDAAAGSTAVTYENSETGDTLSLRVDNATASEGAEQAVVQAKYTTAGDEPGLPTEPVAYADALVLAWGAGDQEAMAQLGNDEVVHILGNGGGPNWAQTGAEGAAGSTIVTYEDSQSGDVLTLRVDNAAASEGAEQAVVEARYETP